MKSLLSASAAKPLVLHEVLAMQHRGAGSVQRLLYLNATHRAMTSTPCSGKRSLEELLRTEWKSAVVRLVFQPWVWSSDSSGYLPATGQSSRWVTGSWSHPERDKAWPVPQMKAQLKAKKHGQQIPGDRIRHSPSLGSDQEGAELPSWWQWCHSRVPCVTLCGPDSACSREGAGRGCWGSFLGTARVPKGCPRRLPP